MELSAGSLTQDGPVSGTVPENHGGEFTLTQSTSETESAADIDNGEPSSETAPAKKISPVGELIVRSLNEKNLTQTDLARLLAGPVAEPSRVESVRRLIQKWIRGDNDPSLGYAAKLAAALDIDPIDVAATLQARPVAPPTATEPDQEALEFARQAAEALNPDAMRADITGRLSHNEITNLFPQFNAQSVLIDEVEELTPESYVRANKVMTMEDWHLTHWWKNSGAVPGVMLTEALAQSAAIALLAKGKNQNRMVFCAAFNNLRFKRIVQPGEEITLEAAIVHLVGSIAHADVVAKVDGSVAVRGRMTLAIH